MDIMFFSDNQKLKNEINSTDIVCIVRCLGFLIPHYLENVPVFARMCEGEGHERVSDLLNSYERVDLHHI
jgi:aspartokinase-like uncharacterized kinase